MKRLSIKTEFSELSEFEVGDLVRATLQGNTGAFGIIIERFEKMALSNALNYLNHQEDAQDAVQEAFWEAYQALPKLKTPEAFPGWFKRIVLKQADRQGRSRSKGGLKTQLTDIAHTIPDFQKPLADQFETVAQNRSVQKGIADLPDIQSQVVSLHYIDGLSQKEISNLLNLPITTIKKRLHDARVNLKRQFNHMNTQTEQAQLENSKAQLIAFYIALRANDLTTIKKYLKAEPELVNVRSEWPVASNTFYWPLGITPFNWAAGVNNLELARILLEHGASINGLENEPFTPLHHAVSMGQGEMVQFLLSSGAEINKLAQNGLTPLHTAVMHEELEIAKQLVEAGADLKAVDSQNQTAGMWAQAKGLSSFAEMFDFSIDSSLANEDGALEQSKLQVETLFGRIINSQGQPLDKRPLKLDPASLKAQKASSNVFETGIKMIDLCMPIKRGRFSGVFTPLSGVGRLLIQGQLMHSIIKNYDGFVVYLGIEEGEHTAETLKMEWQAALNIPKQMLDERFILIFEQDEASLKTKQHVAKTGRIVAETLWRQGHEVLIVVDEKVSLIEGCVEHLTSHQTISAQSAITTIFDGSHTVGLEPAALSGLDSVITFSYERAWAGLWPAIDPLASKINKNWVAQLPSNHREITLNARNLLLRYGGLHHQFKKQGEAGLFYLADANLEVKNAIRGQRLEAFLTQVLPVNEPRVGRVGQLVPLEQTLAGAQSILQGKLDSVDLEKFSFVGAI